MEFFKIIDYIICMAIMLPNYENCEILFNNKAKIISLYREFQHSKYLNVGFCSRVIFSQLTISKEFNSWKAPNSKLLRHGLMRRTVKFSNHDSFEPWRLTQSGPGGRHLLTVTAPWRVKLN